MRISDWSADVCSSDLPIPSRVLNQHLIDPEICIRCNTREETCPIDAITHDGNNYVVDPGICNHCMACVPPCPTGAIDNWLKVLSDQAYSMEDQFGWDEIGRASCRERVCQYV